MRGLHASRNPIPNPPSYGRTRMITELDVTLTDYVLATECALFAYLLCRADRPTSTLKTSLVVFFIMGSIASFTGGTWHGYFHDGGGVGGRVLWTCTLLAIGVSALSAWSVGACLSLTPRLQLVVTSAAAIATLAYAFVVIRVTDSFFAAMVVYLPALVFLTGAFVALYARLRTRELLYGVAGLLLMFVAAAIQRSEVGIDLLDLDHNAFYHLVQVVALALFFKAAWWCVATEQGKESPYQTPDVILARIER